MYYHNFTNDPQLDWEQPKDEVCPDCGSDHKEHSHLDMNDGTNWSLCLDCDTLYETL